MQKPKPNTVKDMEAMGRCGQPGCDVDHMEDGLWLHSRCHPDIPTWARYKQGVLEVTCAKCKSLVGSFKVADE